jgi:hypothetical protein
MTGGVVVVLVVEGRKKETLTPPDDELREIAGWKSPIGFGSERFGRGECR